MVGCDAQESIQGLSSIRCYNKSDDYIVKNRRHCDLNSAAFFAFYTWYAPIPPASPYAVDLTVVGRVSRTRFVCVVVVVVVVVGCYSEAQSPLRWCVCVWCERFGSNRWVSVRLDFVVALLVLSTGLLLIAAGDAFPASLAGLALSYALQMGQVSGTVCVVQYPHLRLRPCLALPYLCH